MIRPRDSAHRGTVVALGFVVDPRLVGAAEARRRILAVWRPSARVRESGGLLVVTGLPARRVRAALAPGAPLVEQHGVVAAMPLAVDEAAALAAPGAVVIARAGVAEVVGGDAVAVDVASWIDLGGFAVVDAAPLAAPPARAEVPPPPSTDVRALTGASPVAAGAAAASTALARGEARPSARRARTIAASGPPSRWRRLAGWLSARLARKRAPAPKALPPPSPGPAGAGAAPAKPSVVDRLRARLAEALWTSRLGAAIGRRHAAYLRRMLAMFDRGELDQALRHAVPLGTGEGGGGSLGLATPRPRDRVELSLAVRPPGAAIPVDQLAMAMMRDRYRLAAKQLEDRGRIDDAAFVLAELLADVDAAIALLERHGRFALAAQLAEARGLAGDLVVRLWFLAGDRQRAIDTARRHRAWAGAVLRLERAGDDQAGVLRMLWADHLADTGDLVQAVEVAWSVEPWRGVVEDWIDRGIAAEGDVAARLLVKKLRIAPASFARVVPQVMAVLERTGPAAARERLALVHELLETAADTTPELRTIARPAVRALVRDASDGAGGVTAGLVDRLVRLTDDTALRADMPVAAPRPDAGPPAGRVPPAALAWSAHDAGVLPVHDAAVLPGDRLVLALGEVGVRIIGRDGRTLAHLDQPATQLVVSDHGTRALAIARRGRVWRLARLDLVDRRGAYWCDAELDSAATTFDGDLWIAARGHEVFAIDTTASRWRAVWGIAVDPVPAACSIRRDGRWFAIAARHVDGLEHWYYEGLTLRARKPWTPDGRPAHITARPTRTGGDAFVMHDDEPAGPRLDAIAAVELVRGLAAVSRRTGTGLRVTVVDPAAPHLLADLGLDGAGAASLRITGNLLVVGDDHGRVIVVDLGRNRLHRELRTR